MAETTLLDGELYHEVRGEGPSLVLVHGGGTDSGAMEMLATVLATRHRVISYDRRGYGRSAATDDQDTATEAADLARVIERLAAGVADVFASSSGAIVALELLATRPDLVRTLVAHEPPLVTLLPDAAERLAFFGSVRETFHREGRDAAMRRHLEAAGMAAAPPPPPDAPLPPHLAAMIARLRPAQDHFLEHEIHRVPGHRLDVGALDPAKLVLAGGEESRETYPYRPNLVIAERLGLGVVDLPGDHIGYVLRPVEFAARLEELLGR